MYQCLKATRIHFSPSITCSSCPPRVWCHCVPQQLSGRKVRGRSTWIRSAGRGKAIVGCTKAADTDGGENELHRSDPIVEVPSSPQRPGFGTERQIGEGSRPLYPEEDQQDLDGDRQFDRRVIQESDSIQKQTSRAAVFGSHCKYVRRTVRFGETVEHAGTVVVLGDVNQGGAVSSDGDVIVLGCLQGDVHAGRGGDREAIVFALAMRPTEICIADREALGPEGDEAPYAEIASLSEDGTISIRPAAEQHYDKYLASDGIIPDLMKGGMRTLRNLRDPQSTSQNTVSQRPALMAFFTGLYIFIAGIALLLFPKPLFGLLFEVRTVTVGWIQVGAILAVVFGLYYIGTAVGDMQGVPGASAFYMSTVVGRTFLFFGFCWLVGTGAAQPALLLVGTVNLVGAMLMLIALQQAPPATSA